VTDGLQAVPILLDETLDLQRIVAKSSRMNAQSKLTIYFRVSTRIERVPLRTQQNQLPGISRCGYACCTLQNHSTFCDRVAFELERVASRFLLRVIGSQLSLCSDVRVCTSRILSRILRWRCHLRSNIHISVCKKTYIFLYLRVPSAFTSTTVSKTAAACV
jgi:hypothetical protein